MFLKFFKMCSRREMSSSCCLVLIFFCLWESASSMLSPKGVNFEVQALMDIKHSLQDPHGVFAKWDDAAVDPCSWTMVTCSSDNLVIGFESPSQSLSGTISPSIANLTNLQIVLLQNNNISGPVPPQVGRLSKLLTLDVSNNSFTGEIPSSLSNLQRLQYMRLNNNGFTGAIPSSLANLTQLILLDLSYNNLSSPVPKFKAKNFNAVGNPLICATGSEPECNGTTNMAMTLNMNSSENLQNHKVGVSVGVSLSFICILSIVVMVFLWWRKRGNEQELQFSDLKDDREDLRLGNLRRFSFRELQTATQNFSNKNILGRGGFGIVYKGVLHNKTLVAVKRLRDGNNFGGETQFQTEVKMISLAVHRNLLKLYGFCATTNERILVYPYMSNGSVASRLKAKPTLDWSTRKRIAIGAARGLLYLHEQCDPKIIHRDVKAANILLDDDCEAVVGDFGLAKLLNHSDSHVTTAVRGTVGHIAPEYLSTGQSSEKTDVYGFGILLLELITGQRTLEFGKSANQKGAMLEWVKKTCEDSKLEMLIDNDLKKNYDIVELQEMVQLAMLCTHYLPAHRPRMSEVVRMLEGEDLAEKWESSQRADPNRSRANDFTSSDRYSDFTDDSSWIAQEMELSGPR